MAAAAYDLQQGATMTFATDSLSLRLMEIPPVLSEVQSIRLTHLGSTSKHTYMPGELKDYAEFTIRYQNSPALANLSEGTVQTITITGPVPPGGTVAESLTGTGFVRQVAVTPGYNADNEALQMKTAIVKFDGSTGPTRTAAS